MSLWLAAFLLGVLVGGVIVITVAFLSRDILIDILKKYINEQLKNNNLKAKSYFEAKITKNLKEGNYNIVNARLTSDQFSQDFRIQAEEVSNDIREGDVLILST